MQRSSSWLLLLATLYVSGCTTATRPLPVPVAAAPAPAATQAAKPEEPATIALISPTIDTMALPSITPPLPPADQYAPHIALILPIKSTVFASYANVVQQGFMTAAHNQTRSFPVRVYNSTDENRDVIGTYRQAIANGAVAVAGPLTRAGVAQLAAYPHITVPTLALNTAEQKPESGNIYFFGLIPETEARQVAQLAFAANLRNATIVNTGSTLSNRLARAFTEEWKKLGGNINAEVIYKDGDDTSLLTSLPTAPWQVEPPPPPPLVVITPTGEETIMPPKRSGPQPVAPGNVAFITGDTTQVRMMRPYLNPSLPVYATSQLYKADANSLVNYDLNDIRFVDMPWLLQPDHAAVMIYPRSAIPLDTEKERLYAFGIDAYRLLHIMLNNTYRRALPLDGVTGRITLTESNVFQREGIPAFFRYGRGLTAETLAVLEAEKAAAKAAEVAARKAALENSAIPPAK